MSSAPVDSVLNLGVLLCIPCFLKSGLTGFYDRLIRRDCYSAECIVDPMTNAPYTISYSEIVEATALH